MLIKAPSFPESISEGELTKWYRSEGDFVERDELLADVETEKTTMEIPAPCSGRLKDIVKQEGEIVESDEILASIDDQARRPEGAAEAPASSSEVEIANPESPSSVSPAARKLALENGISLESVNGSGKNGLITKDDVVAAVTAKEQRISDAPPPPVEPEVSLGPASDGESDVRVERRVPMTRLRATIARRLVDAQQNAAMLTTFNEANMAPIQRMRRQYQDEFTQRHNGTRLGYMSFFVRTCVEALKRFPAVNASIDGDDIVYHGYYDIGVAVSTERGLVVPVVRDADALGLAQIEDQIIEFSSKARDNKLAIEDMQGGTFTISNGGVFGSLLSTPILNPPQTAILGMHKIQDRPVVEAGAVVVRPMMYLAMSYDHRLIDGQEAVRFLVTVKGILEDPARILLEL